MDSVTDIPPPNDSSTLSPDPPSSPISSTSPPTSAPTSEPAPTSIPPTTLVITSIIGPSSDDPGSTVVVTLTSTPDPNPTPDETATGPSSSRSNAAPSAIPGGKDGDVVARSGLSAGAKTAIAVVVPVVVVALLVVGGILLWRKRKARKNAEEARRKEIEEYGFNPNNDPTLPAVGGVTESEMGENQAGYRGWGNTTTTAGTASHRKTSTTVSGGAAATGLSDNGSVPGGYRSPGSPPLGGNMDEHPDDALAHPMDGETIGALGAGPAASANAGNMRRGPSNASSSYSAGQRSEQSSGDAPIPVDSQQYYDNGYYNQNAYDVAYNHGMAGAGNEGNGQQPVIRDVSARRNTRIENPSVWPQQGNSGIAQNF
ncbi:hypothetical protein P152DRAFT_512872 [Eremomyces bilateralis CBS 781.70]|uniref:Mid2 domain-containing protein n=1 Tax=Eremomyces bilateralis CBS 781.70 TaxID=1392243 RepID=A0A6G1G943_9PEZI|nr:uncharacterized protein P152DRAFT_512872 [Eremomyces bilateralis CBS 781.70]KAF1814533.1 hypothetical protein P152DRAFT_512872 [Eremomyces bilateralis CBS 781.70]